MFEKQHNVGVGVVYVYMNLKKGSVTSSSCSQLGITQGCWAYSRQAVHWNHVEVNCANTGLSSTQKCTQKYLHMPLAPQHILFSLGIKSSYTYSLMSVFLSLVSSISRSWTCVQTGFRVVRAIISFPSTAPKHCLIETSYQILLTYILTYI